MRHFIFIIILCSAMSVLAQGPVRVPAYPGVIEKVQPNGDTIHIRLIGDERKHWTITEDGYKIAQNKRGYYCYLRNDCLTCRKVHDAGKRSQCEQRWLRKLEEQN